jgi:fatty acid desaturase
MNLRKPKVAEIFSSTYKIELEEKKVEDFLKNWEEEDFSKEDFGKKKEELILLIYLTISTIIYSYLIFSFIFWSFNPLIWNWYGRLIIVLFIFVQIFASIKYFEKKNIL